ncbi:hypothetical protein [Actinomadura citrea]|uniref:Uncharacterized protein n=1 Tax=Actinomadura citrea TaxID=46158 RepID=A0A7Y9GH50_9ACTN|nr:hypothetical protein [Actinomadura citrea]NYE16399.1 hypothetical protein [Actinomadura citrea]GGT95283.1 hypothetical protein GCM10010177_62910 [Actinomadura citrea]
MNKRQLISEERRQLISLALGVAIGAVIGGIIEGLDYAVFLADLHHRHGIDPFEFGDLGYLATKAALGAAIGALGASGGAFCTVYDGPDSPGGRKIVIRVAGGIATAAVAACVACVALAAFGVAAITITGPLGVSRLGDLLILACGFAVGAVVGAARTDN